MGCNFYIYAKDSTSSFYSIYATRMGKKIFLVSLALRETKKGKNITKDSKAGLNACPQRTNTIYEVRR